MHTTGDNEGLLKPLFLKREIVIDETDKKNTFGNTVLDVGVIAYLGKRIAEEGNYKVGDKVLYYKNAGETTEFFKEKVFRKLGDDTFVFCKLITDESSTD